MELRRPRPGFIQNIFPYPRPCSCPTFTPNFPVPVLPHPYRSIAIRRKISLKNPGILTQVLSVYIASLDELNRHTFCEAICNHGRPFYKKNIIAHTVLTIPKSLFMHRRGVSNRAKSPTRFLRFLKIEDLFIYLFIWLYSTHACTGTIEKFCACTN